MSTALDTSVRQQHTLVRRGRPLRELEETRHQFVRSFVLDSSAATDAFGLAPTPLEQTWADTVAWWRAGGPAARAHGRGVGPAV